MNQTGRFDRLARAALLLAALALRLGWAVSRPTDEATLEQLPDQREYLEVARSLLNGDGLSFVDPRFDNDRVYAYRTPGYPLLLAATGANIRAARIAQSFIDTSTVLAAYLLARRWLPPRACLFASLLVAFDPFLVYFSALLLSETLFTALLAWGMVLITSRRTLPWLLGGVLLALSILVRPGAIALPILLGVLAELASRDREQPRRWPLPAGATMVALTIAILLPWAWRNHRVLGQWVWTSTNAGITSYDGFNPDATGASNQSFVAAMPHLRRMSETDRSEYFASEAHTFIRQEPAKSMQLAVTKIARTWSPMPLSSEFNRPLYLAISLLFTAPFFLLSLLGLFAGRLPITVKLFLLAPAVYLTVAAAASVGSLRYRVPAEVPMAVVAAAGLRAVADRIRSSNLS